MKNDRLGSCVFNRIHPWYDFHISCLVYVEKIVRGERMILKEEDIKNILDRIIKEKERTTTRFIFCSRYCHVIDEILTKYFKPKCMKKGCDKCKFRKVVTIT